MNPLDHFIVIVILLGMQYNQISGHSPVTRKEFAETIHFKEVFKPMGSIVNYNQRDISTPATETMITLTLDQKKERIEKISRCEPILFYLDAQGCGKYFYHMAQVFPTILEAIEEGNEYLENTIITGLISCLHHDNLTASQRISHLAILWAFLEHSALWVLELIGTKIDQTPVSRAVLELSLLKDFDLLEEATEVSKSPISDAEIYPAWLEALYRVDLLDYIRKACAKATKLQPSESLMKIYDLLIKSSSNIEENVIEETTLSCMNIVEKQRLNINMDEWDHHYNILEHLVTFIPKSRSILEGRSLQTSVFKDILDRMSRWIALRKDINKFLSSHVVDLYISSLLLPFSQYKPVTLDHYKYIMKVLEIEEGVQGMLEGKEEMADSSTSKAGVLLHHKGVGSNNEFGVKTQNLSHLELEHFLPTKQELDIYMKDKNFLIDILNRASPDILGANELLDMKISKEGDKYRLKTHQTKAIQDPNGADCAICLSEFFLGQRTVKLECNGGHFYHYTCFKSFEAKKTENFGCPKCRRDIHLPLSIQQHVFWTGEEEMIDREDKKGKKRDREES